MDYTPLILSSAGDCRGAHVAAGAGRADTPERATSCASRT